MESSHGNVQLADDGNVKQPDLVQPNDGGNSDYGGHTQQNGDVQPQIDGINVYRGLSPQQHDRIRSRDCETKMVCRLEEGHRRHNMRRYMLIPRTCCSFVLINAFTAFDRFSAMVGRAARGSTKYTKLVAHQSAETMKLAHRATQRLIQGNPEIEMPDSSMRELCTLEDFESVSSPDGSTVSICGYGSLLSEKSARYTFPNLKNFRLAKLVGFRRVFNFASASFCAAGIAIVGSKEIAVVSAEPVHEEDAIITVFEINMAEVPGFILREEGYRFMAVFPEDLDGTPYVQPVVVCVSSTDEEYRKRVCKGSDVEFFERFGQFGINSVWRDDILPHPVYLRHCILAAKKLGLKAYDNFLDHCYLGDKMTTIRHYLELHPEIMEVKPPPMFAVRYGG